MTLILSNAMMNDFYFLPGYYYGRGLTIHLSMIGGDRCRPLTVVLAIWASTLAFASSRAADQGPVIAVFTKNTTNPAYENFRLGADKAAAAMGARTRHYVPNKPDNVDEQTALIAQALSDKPDLILFVPVDDVAMVEPLKSITEAGIPVVTAVSRISGSVVSFVGSDDVEVGYEAARALLGELGGKGKVVVIEGIPSSPTSRDRSRGFARALKEFPGIELLESGIGNYARPDARAVMVAMLKNHPQIDGVIAANDTMALGALDVLREAGRTATVVGANGILEAIKQIDAGTLLASVDFNTFKMACIAVEAALRSRQGERVPQKITLAADLIDQSNYQAWLVPTSERSCPKWDEIVH
jgi:ribose transport system substrate-binding protein